MQNDRMEDTNTQICHLWHALRWIQSSDLPQFKLEKVHFCLSSLLHAVPQIFVRKSAVRHPFLQTLFLSYLSCFCFQALVISSCQSFSMPYIVFSSLPGLLRNHSLEKKSIIFEMRDGRRLD
mmetsp:Transcript_9400/g.34897  ORF Transcript_9400/g.34897 Transcript_9400/m.34897 type:complete len:122 (-) Transcript_9400:2570-2935(-)